MRHGRILDIKNRHPSFMDVGFYKLNAGKEGRLCRSCALMLQKKKNPAAGALRLRSCAGCRVRISGISCGFAGLDAALHDCVDLGTDLDGCLAGKCVGGDNVHDVQIDVCVLAEHVFQNRTGIDQ